MLSKPIFYIKLLHFSLRICVMYCGKLWRAFGSIKYMLLRITLT